MSGRGVVVVGFIHVGVAVYDGAKRACPAGDRTGPHRTGAGTGVPGARTFREAHLGVEGIAETNQLPGIELVEGNPFLDNRNATAELGVGLICSALGQRILPG